MVAMNHQSTKTRMIYKRMTRDIATDPIVFDPLHDMNDAWLVLRRMADHFAELHSPFAYRLGVTFATPEGFDTFAANLEQLASWTPEKICLAALQVLTSTD